MTSHELPFESKYTYEQAKSYYRKHQLQWRKRLATAIESMMARRALRIAGHPKTVLDLPCGFGRFWPTLIAAGTDKIIAADKSAGMLQVAQESNLPAVLTRVTCIPSTATEIDLPDKSVDSIFCMRLLHHISDKEYRFAIYRAFQRVAKDTVVASFWMKNSLRHKRRGTLDPTVDLRQVNRHFFSHEELQAEFIAAGFDILGHTDMLPYFSPWRTYVLKIKSGSS